MNMDFHEGNYRYLIWTIHPRIIDSRFRYGYQLAFPHELGLNHHFGCCDPFFMNLRWCDPFLPCLMVKPCQNPQFSHISLCFMVNLIVPKRFPQQHQVTRSRLWNSHQAPLGPGQPLQGSFTAAGMEQVAMGSVGKSLVFTCFYSDLYIPQFFEGFL